ncbi:MAG: hypothetical protein ACLPY1_25075, partial [Terracidiphilus sp.]
MRVRSISGAVKAAEGAGLLAVFLLSGCSTVNFNKVSVASSLDSVQPSIATPAITFQPANASVTIGQTATFSVSAVGPGTLTYQWRMNSQNIAGATSASYTIAATTAVDSGSAFDVVVSNTAGSVTSNSATLLVSTPVVSAPTQASYYVALNGSDNADGSESSPFA